MHQFTALKPPACCLAHPVGATGSSGLHGTNGNIHKARSSLHACRTGQAGKLPGLRPGCHHGTGADAPEVKVLARPGPQFGQRPAAAGNRLVQSPERQQQFISGMIGTDGRCQRLLGQFFTPCIHHQRHMGMRPPRHPPGQPQPSKERRRKPRKPPHRCKPGQPPGLPKT